MTTTDEDGGDDGRRGRRRTSHRRILEEAVECTEAVWGQLPSMATVEMHDMLASVINNNSGREEEEINLTGLERPVENRIFAANGQHNSKSKRNSRPPTTSPFYSALQTILATPLEPNDPPENQDKEDQKPLDTEDIGTFSVLARELRDSLILVLTHAGFTSASNECLEVLTDVLHTYLQTFTGLLRAYTDAEDFSNFSADFVDTVSKVMAHMGVPDLDALRCFNDELVEYDRRLKKPPVVIQRKEVVVVKTEEGTLKKDQIVEKDQTTTTTTTTSTIKIKVEDEAMEVQVPLASPNSQP